MDFIKNWLSEKSTWAGIFAVLAAFHIGNLTEEQKTALTLVGISLVARQEHKENSNANKSS